MKIEINTGEINSDTGHKWWAEADCGDVKIGVEKLGSTEAETIKTLIDFLFRKMEELK